MREISAAIRARHVQELADAGFVVAPGLPRKRGFIAKRRAPLDIASRLYALDALVCFVANPQTEESRIIAYIERGNLLDHLTPEERSLVEAGREAALRHVDTIGWRLENMWPLAWALGYPNAPTASGQIQREEIRRMIFDYLPGLNTSPSDLLERGQLRSEDEIAELEDFFYCAHNAVRSAQLGRPTVPDDFHPIADGGAIHERRHALSWCLTDDDWDDVDLST